MRSNCKNRPVSTAGNRVIEFESSKGKRLASDEYDEMGPTDWAKEERKTESDGEDWSVPSVSKSATRKSTTASVVKKNESRLLKQRPDIASAYPAHQEDDEDDEDLNWNKFKRARR